MRGMKTAHPLPAARLVLADFAAFVALAAAVALAVGLALAGAVLLFAGAAP
jgi:hypothetical protein